MNDAMIKTYQIPTGYIPRSLSDADIHAMFKKLMRRSEPEARKLFAHLWHTQAEGLSDNQVSLMAMTGKVPPEVRSQLLKAYEGAVNDELMPLYKHNAEALGEEWATSSKLDLTYKPGSDRLKRWFDDRYATMPVELTDSQVDGLSILLTYGTEINPLPAGAMAARIRGFVGLTRREGQAVVNRMEALRAAGASEGTVARVAGHYETVLRIARGQRIARTEASYAMSKGKREAIAQAHDAGLISGKLVKRWSVATSNVCPICDALDGTYAEIDGEFEGGIDNPPAHPHCDCVTTEYELISK